MYLCFIVFSRMWLGKSAKKVVLCRQQWWGGD